MSASADMFTAIDTAKLSLLDADTDEEDRGLRGRGRARERSHVAGYYEVSTATPLGRQEKSGPSRELLEKIRPAAQFREPLSRLILELSGPGGPLELPRGSLPDPELDQIAGSTSPELPQTWDTSPEAIWERGPRPEAMTVTLSGHVMEFCRRHGLLQALLTAIALVETSFFLVDVTGIEIDEDPETGERWATINIDVVGDIESVLDQYDKYSERWVNSVQWPERGMIRLSYDIA